MLVLFAVYKTVNSTKTKYCFLMFDLITFIDFSNYVLILKLLAATRFKQVGTGATEDCERWWTLQNDLKFQITSSGLLLKSSVFLGFGVIVST